MTTQTEEVLGRLLDLPDVREAVEAAREACTELRWHQALRRRTKEARAESLIRAARASAAIEGSRYPDDLFRDVARGAAQFPDDASGRLALGTVRLLTEAQHWEAKVSTSPAQVLARLHTVVAADLLSADALGRPRRPGELPGDGIGEPDTAPSGAALQSRLGGIHDLMAAPASAPALLVAALVHAEVATARPFLAGNGLLARALARTIVIGRGLDPMGVVVWEAATLDAGPAYARALMAYTQGSPEAVGAWLKQCADLVVKGAAHGRSVCDAILAGRLT
ncbi:hypothetical protein ACIB24_04500 [Spongisporangium articulatum]|uniref:Fido domain-containing protein n=1 Tax=Spongisporangium articulatum TaxID=3362603 RepID=A0ABW8AIX9_9ACTN